MDLVKKTFVKYSPLIFSELYLIFTLLLLFFGPLIWPLQNLTEFILLIASYHLAFISGYIVYVKFIFESERRGDTTVIEYNFNKFFWGIVALAFCGMMISHRNLVHTPSYIPWSFFSDLKKGFLFPAEVRTYYASTEYSESFQGNKYISSLLLLLGVFKYSLYPSLIILWDKLPRIKKIIGFVVAMIPLMSGISISVSSFNFAYVFITIICLGLLFFKDGLSFVLKKRKIFIAFLVILSLFSVWNFYIVRTKASLLSVATGVAVPVRVDYLQDNGVRLKNKFNSGGFAALTDLGEKVTVYLVNGYVGMSISLGEKFESSYGVGHSVFLQRVADTHFGIKVYPRTFQHKITDRWDKDVYWHTAYSYLANDITFWGVTIVMFLLGSVLAMVFLSALMENCFVASLLLPLFGILILYLPANNQIFSFLETMSSFWLLILLFFVSRYKLKAS